MKDKSNNKLRIALITLICILLVGLMFVTIFFSVTRTKSLPYNVITLNTDNLPTPQEQVDEGYVQLSDVKMHYIQYGTSGHPLILLHGNAGDTDSLKEAATYLANDYIVYTVDSRCHGLSSDPGVISYDLMAKDIYEFANAKGLVKPYIMGHSDGGMTAIAIASNYPSFPGAIISCGSNSRPEEFKPYFTIAVKINNAFKPSILNDMMLTLPDFNEEYLGRITCPTYIVAGEYDIMPLSDTVYIHNSIPNSKIAIIAWATHSAYMSHNGKKAYILARDYLNTLE